MSSTTKMIVLGAMVAGQLLQAWSNERSYKPEWESLARHKAAPEWLQDAKLGIYFHWGPYTVPAYRTEWYPRWMWWDPEIFGPSNNLDLFEHHLKTYGHPSKFGYHEFVPMFTGEHFDPEEWADLFQRTGARFAGPVAEHHDGFSMWDSEITPWNAMDRGPRRDVLGELFKALETRGMKTIATFHHAKNLQLLNADTYQAELEKWTKKKVPERYSYDCHFPYLPGHPTSSDDPELQLMYGNMPAEQWHEKIWFGKLKEVVDMYQPDIIWFDSWLDRVPESYRQRFCAYYLNAASDWNKEVSIIRKQDDLPLNFTVNDHEKSREPEALPELWMTDDTLSTDSWSYTTNMKIKSVDKVLHALIDTVSKNGVLLLNISPTAQGVIPEDQRRVLQGLGEWLARNGKAIYGTRPWSVAAEGPTASPAAGLSNYEDFLKLEYTYKDIRYTTSKDGGMVYVITLGIPPAGTDLLLKSFDAAIAPIESVKNLSGQTLEWERSEDGLKIHVPDTSEELSMVFAVELGSSS